jgi:protein-L-isoaspartate(D-aspartate) O-methyltransferase
MDDRQRRHVMVENQLRPSGVTDPRVLEAMSEVSRAAFVPATLRGVAYSDDDLVLPDGRFLIEPLVLGRLLQLAAPQPNDTALVIGCDTGYAGVVLARLAGTVFAAIEPAHLGEVEARVEAKDVVNLFPFAATAPLAGHPAQAPYNVILVAGQVPELPASLTDQLGEGGRLVAMVGANRVGRGTLVTRVHGHVASRAVFDAAVPPLRGLSRAPAFEL